MNLLRYQQQLKLQRAQNNGSGIDISTPIENFVSGVKNVGSEIVEGVKNWWYKNTGRAHFTPEYQHEEELANTAYQRAAADMAAAGLSKYGGVNTASSPTPQSGNGLLATALQMQSLASGVQDLRERAWNYGVSKGLGIRTSDKNPLAGIASVFKLLTGKDLADYSDGDGVVGAIRDWWNGLSFNKKPDPANSPDSPNNPSTVLTAAATDGVQNILQSLQHKDTYNRSRIPLDATVSKYEMPIGMFERAFQNLALHGLSVDDRGIHTFNDYGKSVLHGLALLSHEDEQNVISSFKKWFSNKERRKTSSSWIKDDLRLSPTPPATGRSHTW